MGRVLNRKPLGDVLVDQGFLNRKDLSMALARLGSSPGSLGQALVAEGLITEEQLVSAVAEQHGLPFDLLMNFRVDPKYFQTISIDLMHRHPFVPLGEQDGVLTIAIPDPQNLLGLDDMKLHAPLVSRLKVMSELDIAERRVPQDGRFRMRLDRKTVDFRVSILPSVFGESVVIRILDREAITTGVSALRLERLGFNPEDLRRFRRAITEPHGMVLVPGPTGSGKTTTLYAAITEMNIREDKLITIED